MLASVTSPEGVQLPPNNPPPRHYASTRFGIECIQITRLMSFAAGNAVKYLWRHTDKGGTDDLVKCRDYLGWTAADVLRDAPTAVWLGAAEGMAGRLLIDQWLRPRIDPSSVEGAILLVAEEKPAAALELLAAHLGPHR